MSISGLYRISGAINMILGVLGVSEELGIDSMRFIRIENVSKASEFPKFRGGSLREVSGSLGKFKWASRRYNFRDFLKFQWV